jgi:uncharacterized protein (DUF1501 family)
VFTRRAFLESAVRNSALIALAPTVPAFLAGTALAATPARDQRALVVIQLEGGNDGINTVVPYKDEGYAKYRQALRLRTDELLKVNGEVGFHPAMTDAAKLLESGRLAIVQGVGYPNPSRSHFRSRAIWETARVNRGPENRSDETADGAGWLGQALDAGPRPEHHAPDAVFVGVEDLPLALRGRQAVVSSLDRPEDYFLALKDPGNRGNMLSEGGSSLAAFVTRHTLDAYVTCGQMADVLRGKGRGAGYPASESAGRLEVIARLLKGDVGSRVFYTTQAWYDTHASQLPEHARLLGEFSSALRAFLDDLAAARLAERVAVLVFSEFGRRVAENGSRGTDHGTAGPVFVAGPGVRAAVVGKTPRLLDLEDGDLKMSIDFRQVYSTMLEDWLGLPSKAALAGTFERLPLFRS